MDYLRDNICAMESYVPGIQPKDPAVIKLNTNENPFPPTEKVVSALMDGIGSSLRLYPDPSADEMRTTLQRTFGFKKEQFIVGNGSDELIAIIMRAVLNPKDDVSLLYPTYTLYNVLAKASDANIIESELDENLDIPDSFLYKKAKLCFVPNPNVPSGKFIKKDTLSKLASNIGGVLVIDEAYADFCDANCLDLINKHDNIIITRSFSKSFSLAGLRIGFAVASEYIIDNLTKVKDSYNLNRLSLIAAKAALEDIPEIKKRIAIIRDTREKTAGELIKLGFEVFKSDTNFLFVKPPKFEAIYMYKKLVDRKILVRFFNHRIVDKYLRITIGTKEEMDILLNNIRDILENN